MSGYIGNDPKILEQERVERNVRAEVELARRYAELARIKSERSRPTFTARDALTALLFALKVVHWLAVPVYFLLALAGGMSAPLWVLMLVGTAIVGIPTRRNDETGGEKR